MSPPRVVAVDPASPAARARLVSPTAPDRRSLGGPGLHVGDEIVAVNGLVPRDVIEYQQLVDEARVELDVQRGGLPVSLVVDKDAGEPLGVEVHTPLFDQVRTCDNHCEFCFIYQLPKGLRPTLYVKDDDYRLSFLYGNFTTLTRFNEADLERVVTERLSPLFVSIHATDPDVRARMLRNRRGATSLRWLRALLDHGVEVHGQVVCCPGVNDATVLHDTLAGILDQYPELATTAVVPLGVSRHSAEANLRPHSHEEAADVLDAVGEWQGVFLRALGRRLVFAADEYYLLAGRPFPDVVAYEGFPQHENGVGMATAFAGAMLGDAALAHGARPGFFAWVEGAPAAGYRAPRLDGPEPAIPATKLAVSTAATPSALPTAVLTGTYGAAVLEPLLARVGRADVRVVPVTNEFFGGNIGVAGLLVGCDLARVLSREPEGHRYLLPDVCLSQGKFLDGLSPADLPRAVEVVPSDGLSLRRALLGDCAA